jgi:hypothetical protein
VDHSVGLRGGVGSTFSWEQCIRPTLLMTHERVPRMGTTCRKRTLGVRGMLVGFSPVGCTSIQIAVTLGYE